MSTLSLLGCKKSNEDFLPISNEYNYPLKVGNSWIYNLKSGNENFKFKWEVIQEDTLNGRDIYIIQKYIFENNTYKPTYKDYCYNDVDGLYLLATTDTAYIGIPDFKPTKVSNSMIKLSNTQEDTLIIFNSPIKNLHYPLIIGEKWIARNDYKKYVNKVIIDSKIGRIECIILEDEPLYGEKIPNIKQYISQKGLVKEVSYLYITDEVGKIDRIDSISMMFELMETNF